jgi:hypothetical protein
MRGLNGFLGIIWEDPFDILGVGREAVLGEVGRLG